jgi:oxygen-dependent protoporphyrinogen oxidase
MEPGMNSQGRLSVAVVGGGVSGLAAAFYLQGAAEVTLLEQSSRLGGVIQSETEGEFCWEMGPDSMLSQKPAGMQLVEDLGIGDRLIDSNIRSVYVVQRGRLVAFPAGFQFFVPKQWTALARTPLLSWRAKLTALAETFRRRRAPEGDLTVADFVRSRLGREIYEYLAEPLLSGIYGGDAEQLSMFATLPQFLAYERSHGNVIRGVISTVKAMSGKGAPKRAPFVCFRNGMQELTDALAARLTCADVRREEGVVELARDGSGWRVNGKPFDAVVLATPAWAAARLLNPTARDAAEILQQIPYTSSITVSLGFRAADLPAAEGGYGYVAPRIENRPVLACSWLSAKYPHRAGAGYAYVRGFLGGARFPHLIGESDERLTGLVLDELRALMDVRRAPVAVRVARWKDCMAQPVMGHPARIAELRRRLVAYPGLALAGNYLDGIGIPDCIRSAKNAVESVLAKGTPATAGASI